MKRVSCDNAHCNRLIGPSEKSYNIVMTKVGWGLGFGNRGKNPISEYDFCSYTCLVEFFVEPAKVERLPVSDAVREMLPA